MLSAFESAEFLKTGVVMSTARGTLLVGWGERSWHSEPQGSDAPWFYFPDFFLSDPNPWFTHQFWREMTCEHLRKVVANIKFNKFPPLRWRNDQIQLFEAAFHDLQKRFASNELVKAVPYAFETSRGCAISYRLPQSLVHLLEYASDNPLHIYGFWEEGQGVLGATPELLFHLRHAKDTFLETVACAGTKKLWRQDRSFFRDSKELHEHNLVIEGIKKSLVDLASDIKVERTQVLKLPAIAHLVTPIVAKLERPIPYSRIVQSMHPTPALGAVPLPAGLEWLKNYQLKVDRLRYGAPAGYIEEGGKVGRCFVAIRNMQWKKGWIGLGAGCGVVPASRLENELQELQLKIASIKEMLAI